MTLATRPRASQLHVLVTPFRKGDPVDDLDAAVAGRTWCPAYRSVA